MPKVNTVALLMQAKAEILRLQKENAKATQSAIKFCADAAVIAAHNVFLRKGDKIAEFRDEYQRLCLEIAQVVMDDSETQARDNSYLEYSKTRIDEAVRDALTDKYFLPWDTRHQMEGRENKKETEA